MCWCNNGLDYFDNFNCSESFAISVLNVSFWVINEEFFFYRYITFHSFAFCFVMFSYLLVMMWYVHVYFWLMLVSSHHHQPENSRPMQVIFKNVICLFSTFWYLSLIFCRTIGLRVILKKMSPSWILISPGQKNCFSILFTCAYNTWSIF